MPARRRIQNRQSRGKRQLFTTIAQVSVINLKSRWQRIGFHVQVSRPVFPRSFGLAALSQRRTGLVGLIPTLIAATRLEILTEFVLMVLGCRPWCLGGFHPSPRPLSSCLNLPGKCFSTHEPGRVNSYEHNLFVSISAGGCRHIADINRWSCAGPGRPPKAGRICRCSGRTPNRRSHGRLYGRPGFGTLPIDRPLHRCLKRCHCQLGLEFW